MRLIVNVLIIFYLSCSVAWADWAETFRTNFQTEGIDTAVSAALGEGIPPVQIIGFGIGIEDLPPPHMIKALFCALVQPSIIYDAAEANQLQDATVNEGYQLALAQCPEVLEEQVNAAPNAAFPGAAPAGKGRPSQASPWNFN